MYYLRFLNLKTVTVGVGADGRAIALLLAQLVSLLYGAL